MAEISEFFFASQTSVLQDPIVICVKKKFKNFVLVLEMAISEHFW